MAGVLTGVAAFGAWPALAQGSPAAAPVWAQGALLLALLQLAYVAWMAVLPDRATLQVVLVVYVLVAAIYAAGAAMALAMPAERPLPLDLEAYRHRVAAWCGLVMLSTTLAAYLGGRTAAAWATEDRRRGALRN